MQNFSPDQIAQLAYQLWQERGCPDGSPEVDWERAVRLLESPSTQSNAVLSAPAPSPQPVATPPPVATPQPAATPQPVAAPQAATAGSATAKRGQAPGRGRPDGQLKQGKGRPLRDSRL